LELDLLRTKNNNTDSSEKNASGVFGSGATGKQTVESGSNASWYDALAAILAAIATVTRVKQ